MSTGILIGLATEWAGLHHRNETHLDLEIFSTGVNLESGWDLASRQSRVITECLLGHSSRSWHRCDDWFGCREWSPRWYETSSSPHQKWLWIGMKVLRQVETGHTLPCFHINKTRKQSQVSLFSMRIPISILFKTLSIYSTMCLPRQWCQKCLLAPTNVTSDDTRRCQFWGGSISWTTNKSASARNTTVAVYPGVYWGVIYISVGKAVSERIYRLVGELYLDWIFSSI